VNAMGEAMATWGESYEGGAHECDRCGWQGATIKLTPRESDRAIRLCPSCVFAISNTVEKQMQPWDTARG
jgi:hypothetical protein